MHIHLGLGTFFLFGDSDEETSPFRGFVIISDIYVMAIYHFYKAGKKTFYFGYYAFGGYAIGGYALGAYALGAKALGSFAIDHS